MAVKNKHPKQGGVKFDLGKPRMDLLDPYAIEQLAKVLTFGANRYGDYNWQKGIKYSRILAAIGRHWFKYMSGESIDPESGLSHIAHIMCNCLFLLHFEKYQPTLDDRPNFGKTKRTKQRRTLQKHNKTSKSKNPKPRKRTSKK